MPGKRKRLDDAGSVSAASDKPLSAIAAARLRAEAAATVSTARDIVIEPVSVPSTPLPQQQQSPESSDYDESSSAEDIPIKQSWKLCSWRDDTSSILSDTDSELTINLNRHTTIALIGCFEFRVFKGAVHINGANIGATSNDGRKDRLYRVFAPATHPVAKIRGLDATNHIRFTNCQTPAPLAHLSPLFESLWSASLEGPPRRSFSVVSQGFFFNLVLIRTQN